jgi:hypothetical protein
MCNACTSTQTCSTANVCEGPVEPAGAGGFGGPTNAGGSSGQGGAGGQSTAAVLRVFVTSNRYPGNIGGVTQGDAICTLAAEAGNKGGTWKAFLASSTEDAVSRMADVGPWYQERLIGFAPVKTFNNRANLTTTALAALRYDEQGRDLVSPLFWTGNRTSLNCMSWSSTSGYARTGNDDSLDLTDWSCTGRASLLCVEQSRMPAARPLATTMKRVFVTSNQYPGNIGGVTQGDAICTLAAQAANKGGAWKAFLASSTEDAVSRMADVGPWYQERLIGFAPVKTFNNRANLTTTALAALRYDEQGRDLVSPLFWTGNRTSLNCMSWSSTSGYARTGNDDSLDLTDWSCTGRASLLCVEQ